MSVTEIIFYTTILTIAELVFIVIAMYRSDMSKPPSGGDFMWAFYKFYVLNLIFIIFLSK